MTLRKRTFLIVGAVVAGFTGLLYLSARTVLLGGFARIEEETVPQEVVLVATVLAAGLAVSGLVLLLLERLVFRRLAALSSAVRGIGRGVDVKARIPAEGRD